MKDEIKEINIKFPGQILDYVDTKEHLLELFNYITNLQEENERKSNIIKKIRKMLYKRMLDDYDTYTANVVCDFQSDFEEIVRLNGGDEE